MVLKDGERRVTDDKQREGPWLGLLVILAGVMTIVVSQFISRLRGGADTQGPQTELVEPVVEWSGVWPSGLVPDTNCIDPGFYGAGGPPPVHVYDKGKELGFREDGVVVWRTAR